MIAIAVDAIASRHRPCGTRNFRLSGCGMDPEGMPGLANAPWQDKHPRWIKKYRFNTLLNSHCIN